LGITTTYVYDALNRVTSRTYTNDPQSTPAVSYRYDNQTLPGGAPTFTRGSSIGRLVAVTYGTGSAGSYQGYDQLGRVNVSYQQTDSINYGFSYGYNLASEMTSETYPSGRQVITEYDSAGRTAGISAAGGYYAGATASDASNRIQYAPHGAVSVMLLGNGKWEHTNFNNRLQPTQIGLGTSGTDSSVLKLDYGYGTTTNNGNVMSQTITAPSLTVNQCYGYDSLNRLTSAEEKNGGTACSGTQQWKQAFTYDRFGNRNFDPVNTTSNVLGPNPTISQSTNRIASGQNYGYDSAGNLTSDPTTNANGVVYDGENRQTQYTKTGQATNYYYYDGDGHRIKKIDSSGTTVFVYNAGGQLIAEYTAGNPSSGGTSYLTGDHLGSTRVVMRSDGTTTRHDFLPFGEELQAGIGGRTTGQGYVADNVRQKFTQKERDNESGLDYFLARYYSSAQGRFTSVDPITMKKARLIDPQRFNLYCYTRNNPLKYIDPDGADILLAQGLKPKQREFLVKNLARLYMTEKGREILERADRSPYNIEIGKGELERKRVGPPVPSGTTVIGGTEHVVGGLTSYDSLTDKKTKEKYLMASGPPGTESFNPITVKVDTDNTSAMGKDPATVLAHELGGHVSNVLNLAERPDPNSPEGRPEGKITGLDAKADEESSKAAEKVGKFPDKPTPEAIRAVEELLKKRE
jgi:RHS repeat-associated protein